MRPVTPLRALVPLALVALAFGAVLLVPQVVSYAAPDAPATGRDWRPTTAAFDAAIDAHLAAAGVKPAARADDGEFLRRVMLDLTGTIPTAAEAKAFRANTRPDKREAKVEELLASPAYAESWAHAWYRWLTGMTPGAARNREEQARLLRGPADETFQAWLLEQMKANRPYDALTRDLLTATGRTNQNGATGFYARWDGKPNDLAGAVSKTFLGVKIQCAQCHDHMYEATWKQKDFQGMAAFFVLATPRPVPEYQQAFRAVEKMREERMKEQMDEDGTMDGGDGKGPGGNGAGGNGAGGNGAGGKGGEGKKGPRDLDGDLRRDPAMREALRNRYVMDIVDADPRSLAAVRRRSKGDKLPEQVQERAELADVAPKAWMGPVLTDLPGLSRRDMLARWVTSADNPYFAQALANRYVGHLFGRGFVNPVDDFTSMNPASHPEALQLLASDLKANGYDLKRLLRVLVNSAAYQRTSRWQGDEPDPQHFARGAIKPLSSEQMFDALVRATGSEALLEQAGRRQGSFGAYGRGNGKDAAFSAFSFVFEDDEGAEADEFAGNIPQGLFLMNGRMLQGALSALPGTTVGRVLSEESTDAARLDALYLAAYARSPDAEERRSALAYVRRSPDERSGWQDLFWVLLNSAEFMSNH